MKGLRDFVYYWNFVQEDVESYTNVRIALQEGYTYLLIFCLFFIFFIVYIDFILFYHTCKYQLFLVVYISFV